MNDGATVLAVLALCLLWGARGELREPRSSTNAARAAGQNLPAGSQTAPRLVDIQIAFKLDPRLTKGLYMGDRWVSPPTYSILGEADTVVVNVRAVGLDSMGNRTRIRPRWSSTDTDVAEVTPAEGDEVRIIVQRSGESRVHVVAKGISRELAVKATPRGKVLQVDVSQHTKAALDP